MPQWDCMMDDKATALAKIKGKGAGAFVLRPSDKAFAAISVVKPDGSMFHQHIEDVGGGRLRMKKSTAEHTDMAAFVLHYSQPSQADLPTHLNEDY
jgi:hypothetical protein